MAKVTISEFIISIVELLEAQVKEIESSFLITVKNLIIKMFILSLFVIATIFFFLGIKIWIEGYLGEILAYFITSFLICILALLISKVILWKIEQER